MKHNIIISSYTFFVLSLFTILALLASEFTTTFSQLFALLSKNGRIYDVFSMIICIFGIVGIFNTAFFIYKRKDLESKKAVTILTIASVLSFILLVFLFFHLLEHAKSVVVNEISVEDDIRFYKFTSYAVSLNGILFFLGFIFFVLLPVLYRLVSLDLNLSSRTGRLLSILEPNKTTIIIFLCAAILEPSFAFSDRFFYIDSVLFLIGAIMFLVMAFMKRANFRFYDYVNIVMLSLTILVILVSVNAMSNSDFYNARFCFLILGFVSWTSSWINFLLKEES
ncbi:hypothetical protein BKH43_04240 [Helicobacter sp. 13S00401-1]|uniref:hypothetical protein n=1 Tax=Helicobacter sp. 13S00401-1 TaxID=1905758 RepID=UPI000BA5088D|nr:hypothetical protein [Helicobacter sp. 13S00401-1]PAF50773.1 hypothetical protein BKH43_04240 [Helicobacter sp. 13S00401-1]